MNVDAAEKALRLTQSELVKVSSLLRLASEAAIGCPLDNAGTVVDDVGAAADVAMEKVMKAIDHLDEIDCYFRAERRKGGEA
ncbi:MAG: hypothetical protein RBT64_12840 [Trichloromonas sp.]|jgi:hypothetical protein|nr:hypothetical protein [Trichloromonas sp.]